MTTNGVTTEPLVPTNVMRQILIQERAGWQQNRARYMLGLELNMEIARELGVDKSTEIKQFEGRLAECLVCIRRIDAKLSDLPSDAPPT